MAALETHQGQWWWQGWVGRGTSASGQTSKVHPLCFADEDSFMTET